MELNEQTVYEVGTEFGALRISLTEPGRGTASFDGPITVNRIEYVVDGVDWSTAGDRVYTRSWYGIGRKDAPWNRDAVTSNARKKIDDAVEKAVKEVLAKPGIAGIARRQAIALAVSDLEHKLDRNSEEVTRLLAEQTVLSNQIASLKTAIEADRAISDEKHQAHIDFKTEQGTRDGEAEAAGKTWSEIYNLERESWTTLERISKQPAGAYVCAATVAYHEARRKALRDAADKVR